MLNSTNSTVSAVMFLLLSSLPAFAAAADLPAVATDRDVQKAMQLMPADLHKSLQPPQQKRGTGINGQSAQESPQCRDLRLQMEREKHSAPQPLGNTYPETSSKSLNGNKPTRPGDKIVYSPLAKLELTYRKQCQ